MTMPKVTPNVLRAWVSGWVLGAIILYLYIYVIYRNESNDAALRGGRFWSGFIPCVALTPIVIAGILLYSRFKSGNGTWKSIITGTVLGTLCLYAAIALAFGFFIGFVLLIMGTAG